MAIAAANVAYRGTGPAQTNQVVAETGATGVAARRYVGVATFTGDGAASSAQINWIDGTKTLPFTPAAVLFSRSGGDATATITATEVEITDAAKGTVTFSAAPGNGNTVKVTVMICE